jgi:hypothetical protein
MKQDLKKLTEIFASLGARDPEGWAKSQLEEGINQLHRFLFLKRAWQGVISEDKTEWIDAIVAESKKHPTAPFSGIGLALERMLAKGVDRDDIVDLVRGMQAETLFSFCTLLEDDFSDDPELEELDVHWALAEVDLDPETFEIEFTGNAIQALHESVLSTDPTGREMRPRPRG